MLMEQVIVAVIATHLLVGTLICSAFAKASGYKVRLPVCFAAALTASLVGATATALLFSAPGLNSLPGGFMEGGLFTLLLIIGVFTVVWLVVAALITPQIARRFSAPTP
jgi:hypothetical protein